MPTLGDSKSDSDELIVTVNTSGLDLPPECPGGELKEGTGHCCRDLQPLAAL